MVHAVIAVLTAVGFSVLVLALSSVVVAVLARRLKGKPKAVFGIFMQVSVIVFTLLITFLVVRNPSVLGALSIPLMGLIEGAALAGLVSF